MSIVSYETNIYRVRHGDVNGFRLRVVYTLDDGRLLRRGPIFCNSVAHGEQLAIDLQSRQLIKIQKSDSQEAVSKGITTAYKYATLKRVQFAYMESAINAKDAYQTYDKMRHFVQSMIDAGFSDAQLANNFDTSIKFIQKVKARWNYLKNHKDTLIAYKSAQEGI